MNSGYQHDHHDNNDTEDYPRYVMIIIVDTHLENKPYLRNPAALVSPWKDPSTPTSPTTRPLRRCCRQIRHGSPFLPEHIWPTGRDGSSWPCNMTCGRNWRKQHIHLGDIDIT